MYAVLYIDIHMPYSYVYGKHPRRPRSRSVKAAFPRHLPTHDDMINDGDL